MLRVARFASARKRVQMSGRVGRCRKIRQPVGDRLRRHSDQFVIIRPRKQILTIFVRLPRRIQDAGDETRGLRGKERPELAGIGQPVERHGPPDGYVAGVVERTPVAQGLP